MFLRTFLRICFFGLNLLLLLAALIPWLNPGHFWFIAILGIVYPYLLFLVFLLLIFLAIRKSKWVLLPLILLLLNIQQLRVVFALPPEAKFGEKDPSTLRILSWNVNRWTEGIHSMSENQGNSYRQLMFDAVRSTDADVLCFQEFFQSNNPVYFPDNIQPIREMGYPYVYFSPAFTAYERTFEAGLVIFSRYPIRDSAFFRGASGEHSEGFSYADIEFKGKKVRVFNMHLESPGFNRESIQSGKIEGVRLTLSKLRNSYFLRKHQADMMRDQMDKSPHPIIATGDVDDFPNSYAYFKVRGNLKDAFLRKGSGFGKTFQAFLPNLRIDYVFVDQRIELKQYEQPDFKYSDHLPMLFDVRL